MPDWNGVLTEIQQTQAQFVFQQQVAQAQAQAVTDTIRRKYLMQLHQQTERNVIAYYSGFLSKPRAEIEMLSITDEDKNGFMTAIHNLDRAKGLDIMLHTPGGSMNATHSLVMYLRKMFKNDIRVI